MKPLARCQCKNFEIPCFRAATQEDLLCDVCRETHSLVTFFNKTFNEHEAINYQDAYHSEHTKGIINDLG